MLNTELEKTRKKSASKKIVFVGAVSTLLLWLFMIEAGGDLENQIKKIRFAPHPTFSRIIFEMEKDFTYSLTPDLKSQQLVLKIPATKIPENFPKRHISDARINDISLTESKVTGELLITVYLKYKKNSIYHLSLEGPPRLVLDIKNKNGAAKGSARSVLKRKSFPELEEKPEPVVAEAEPPVEEAPYEEEVEAAPEDAEPVAGEMVDGRRVYSPEEVARREEILMEIERRNAGKDLYIEGLKQFQQTKYADAYLKFKQLTQKFPESALNENAYYLMGDCQLNLVDEKQPDYTGTVHDIRKALRKFPQSPNRDAALFKLSQMYSTMGLDLEALAATDEIIRDFGGKRYGLQAKLMKANVFYDRQDYDRAYALYKEVIKISPYSPEAKSASFSIAKYLYDTNNHEKALKVYIEASKRWPTYPKTHPSIIFNVGKLYYDKKDFTRARENFYNLVNLYPNYDLSTKAMNLLGDSYLTEGKELAGMKIFSETANRNPGTPEGNYGRMKIAEIGVNNPSYTPKKKIFETYEAYYEPIKTYREISKKSTDDPTSMAIALLHEGVALSKKKQFFKAIAAFRQIHQEFPGTAQSKEVKKMIQASFFDMVNTYYGQDGFFPLVAAYHENLDPYLRDIKDIKTLLLIADVYQKIGLHDTAFQIYQSAQNLDEKGQFKEALIMKLSTLHMVRGNHEEAEDAFARFIKAYPKSSYLPEASYKLGNIMFQQKKYKEAITPYSGYVNRFPKAKNLSRIYSQLGKSLKETKQYPQAIVAFQNSIKHFKPKDSKTRSPEFLSDNYFEIGNCYYLTGQYEKTIKAYTKAIKKFEDDPRKVYANYFMGESYARLKKNKSAESTLQQMAESNEGQIWSKAAELSNNSIKWEKGYQEVM